MTLSAIRFFLIFAITLSYPVTAVTKVSVHGNLYTFDSAPRLADVLAPVALKEDWYWSASSLFRLSPNKLNETRNEVISKLEKMLRNDSLGTKQQDAIAQLINQILQWKLAERIPISIDYDAARSRASLNPLFDEGDYLLHLRKRPTKVQVFGALLSENMLSHKDAADISEYVAQVLLPPFADNDYVYIIRADGRPQRVPYAYWNKTHHEIMPGSQLYIPFKPQFFSTGNEELNEQIVLLAVNRILL